MANRNALLLSLHLALSSGSPKSLLNQQPFPANTLNIYAVIVNARDKPVEGVLMPFSLTQMVSGRLAVEIKIPS